MKARILLISTLLFSSLLTQAKIWTVGPVQTYTVCSQVVSKVGNGDTVYIEAGTYVNDVQVKWTASNMLIKGIGGRPILRAGSAIANDPTNGKGIFVVAGNNTIIENIEFRDAKVQSNNGAGIRQEGAGLIVRYCVFDGNEMGILQGGTIANCNILVEHCVFLNGGSTANPGYQHNIYINHIDTFTFRYNFSHDAIAQGHELKSRANNNFILYNRISNLTSEDSRNIDLPNGGSAVIMGNVIEQNQNSANSNIIGFGLEGLVNPGPHNLFVCNNTVVNRKTTGSFININAIDSLVLFNNIYVGAKTGGFIIGTPAFLDSSYNLIEADINKVGFNNPSAADYRLLSNSAAVNAGKNSSRIISGYLLVPSLEYKDTAHFVSRWKDAVIDIGAFEYQKPANIRDLASSNLQVFPNPFQNTLYVKWNESSRDQVIEIRSIQGKKMYEQKVNANAPGIDFIDSYSWANGIYMIIITSTEGVVTSKLIKQ